jgi:hypothetical protein
VRLLNLNPNKLVLVQRSGRSHLTVIRTHIFRITSFPVLPRIINYKSGIVKWFFESNEGAPVFVLIRIIRLDLWLFFFSLKRWLTTSINPPRMFDPKEVRNLAVVFAIVNHKVGDLTHLQ